MILLPHILIIITLLFLVTKWRIEENILWSDWAIFTTILLGLLAAFTYELVVFF
jgi:hypothetical protein